MGCCVSAPPKTALLTAPSAYQPTEADRNSFELKAENEEDAAFLHSLDKDVNWQFLRQVDGVDLSWAQVRESGDILGKGCTVFDVSALTLFQFLTPHNRTDFDDLAIAGRTPGVTQEDDFEMKEFDVALMWMKLDFGVPGIKQREFLMTRRQFTATEGTHYVFFNNLPSWSKHPPSKLLVRGKMVGTSGWIIRPLTENTCEAVLFIMINVGGWVPNWLTAKMMEETVKMVHRIKRHLQQRQSK
eukprot:c1039_g1_i1.p1 GENE.c1039_g1_i1~~c1039_g1_i1.p1  ORF type:complete len:243 (-),score=55.68 c1039_g1_i1:34-762(-)